MYDSLMDNLSLRMVLQIRHPIGIVRTVRALEPVLVFVLIFTAICILLLLLPGLCVTSKKVPL